MNVVTLVGRISNDLVLRQSNGITTLDFSIAVKRYTKKDPKHVFFIDCVAFNNEAKNMNQYVKKGSPIAISGELDIELYKTNEGQTLRKPKITVRHVEFLTPIGNVDNGTQDYDDRDINPFPRGI